MEITTNYEVLSAAADDWESLDQILLSVRFEFANEFYDPGKPTLHYWRDRNPAITLAEIAGELRKLVESGHMIARHHDGTLTTTLDDVDIVSAWFRTTETGLAKLTEVHPV
jgi:ribulose bisphosphate carboxylase small subunit